MARKPHSTSLVLLLVCIFTFWWGISVLAQNDLRGTVLVTDSGAQPATATRSPLLVSETEIAGTYTYSGTYVSNSVCDSVGSGIKYSAANGGHVSVLLITQPSSTACAQAATLTPGEPFSVSIKPGSGVNPAFDGVILNGSTIPSQLIEAK